MPRLFIIDGAKALSKAIRRTFGRDTPIQRCQVHKARNIVDRLPKHRHASTRRALRQAWELDDAEKAEKLLRNLARSLEREAPGVAGAILEGECQGFRVLPFKRERKDYPPWLDGKRRRSRTRCWTSCCPAPVPARPLTRAACWTS